MSSVIFDASALLITVNQELGLDAVEAIDGDIVMSSVNLAEVVTKLAIRGTTLGVVEEILAEYHLAVAPFTERLSMIAGMLVTKTRHRGLSLADRACLALAIELRLPVITADRAWADLDLGIEIRLVR